MITILFLMLITACNGKTERKKQMITSGIAEMKSEMDSIRKATETNKYSGDDDPSVVKQLQSKFFSNTGDSIVGVWEVKNEYYMAIYEIIKYDDQYFGKVHYYNDGTTEYTGNNNEEDYFLEDVFYNDGKYSTGKMYMPDGSHYQVKFTLKGDDLTVQITLEGEPYSETWKRK